VPAAVVAEARRLARKNPWTGQRRSLREIAAELAKRGHCGCNERAATTAKPGRL
jgi:hypothetical protein